MQYVDGHFLNEEIVSIAILNLTKLSFETEQKISGFLTNELDFILKLIKANHGTPFHSYQDYRLTQRLKPSELRKSPYHFFFAVSNGFVDK